MYFLRRSFGYQERSMFPPLPCLLLVLASGGSRSASSRSHLVLRYGLHQSMLTHPSTSFLRSNSIKGRPKRFVSRRRHQLEDLAVSSGLDKPSSSIYSFVEAFYVDDVRIGKQSQCCKEFRGCISHDSPTQEDLAVSFHLHAGHLAFRQVDLLQLCLAVDDGPELRDPVAARRYHVLSKLPPCCCHVPPRWLSYWSSCWLM